MILNLIMVHVLCCKFSIFLSPKSITFFTRAFKSPSGVLAQGQLDPAGYGRFLRSTEYVTLVDFASAELIGEMEVMFLRHISCIALTDMASCLASLTDQRRQPLCSAKRPHQRLVEEWRNTAKLL